MEDKTFELLTKMYSELTGRLDEMDKRFTGKFDEMGRDIKGLKNDVIRLENKLDSNSKALFDGYHQTYNKLAEIEDKLDRISVKVDRQEVEIKVIKGGKG